MKKKILLFTGNRAEYGLQLPIIKLLQKNKKFETYIITAGSHLDPKYGKTINEFKKDKIKSDFQIKFKYKSQITYTPEKVALIISKMTKILSNIKPHLYLCYADRFETFGAAVAASLMNIPIAHVEGGDVTFGGTHDDNLRHAISKISHIHFTSNLNSKKRLILMGEEKWRVHNVGFSGLDLIKQKKYANKAELIKKFNLNNKLNNIIFTYHPLTLEFKKNIQNLKPCIDALLSLNKNYNIIITFPNNDLGNSEIIKYINKKTKNISNVHIYKSLGSYYYLGFLSLCLKNSKSTICLGNSSSGIKETASFKCPTINIQPRQNGRDRNINIIDVNCKKNEILKAVKFIEKNDRFINLIRKSKNIYGNGNSSIKILNYLEKLKLNKKLLNKKHFY